MSFWHLDDILFMRIIVAGSIYSNLEDKALEIKGFITSCLQNFTLIFPHFCFVIVII